MYALIYLITSLVAATQGQPIFDSSGKNIIGYYNRIVSHDTGLKITTIYQDPEKKELVTETFLQNPDQSITYEIRHHQLNKQGKIDLKSDIIFFELTEDGKTKTSTEPRRANSLTPLQLVSFIENNIVKLEQGQELPIELAVWERRESVRMLLSNTRESPIAVSDKTRIIRMKPSNFIIAQLVNPFFFYYDVDQKRVTKMYGRLAIKRREGTKWKDVEGILPIPALEKNK